MLYVSRFHWNDTPPPPVISLSYWDLFQNPRPDLVSFRWLSLFCFFLCQGLLSGFCSGMSLESEVWWRRMLVVSRQRESREGSLAGSEWVVSESPGVHPVMHHLLLRVNLDICKGRCEFLRPFQMGHSRLSLLLGKAQELNDIHWIIRGSVFSIKGFHSQLRKQRVHLIPMKEFLSSLYLQGVIYHYFFHQITSWEQGLHY